MRDINVALCSVLLPLPKTKDSTSPRVVLLRQGFENMDIVNVLKINLMIGDILLLEDDNVTICGEHILQDMKLLTLTATKMFSPTLVKKASTCFQNAYPVRPKGIFFFNTNSFFELVYSLFKTFMKEKMKKRVSYFLEKLILFTKKITNLKVCFIILSIIFR